MPGHIIKRYREMRNFSQKYVAAKMNISQNAYSKIENNITQLTVHHVKILAQILDVSIMELLKDDFEIHKPVTISKNVTKVDLGKALQRLQEKVEGKHVSKDDHYIVAMSLIKAAEDAISEVH